MRRDDGDGVFSQKGFAKDEVAGGGDGEALRKGINVGHMMEKFTEFEAATMENVDIRLAVAKNLGLEVKYKLLTLKVIVPRVEFLAIVWIHTIGVIVHGSWKGSHIVLVLCTVKEVGKVAFFQLCEAEGLGEIRQMHGNKTERIDKFDVQLCYGEGKDLCATSYHFWSNAILVEILEDKVPIVSLEIMGDEGRAGVLFLEDALTELVFGIVPRKHELVAAFVLDHAEVRDVLTFILGALEIEKHETLFSFDGVIDIVIHRNIIVEELVICVFSGRSWFPCFDQLHVALVVFWFDVLLADCASNKTTMMIVETGSGYHALTSLTLGQGSAEGFLLTCGVLVSDKALVAFKETVAILTISPLDNGSILRIAQLAEVSTGMVGDLVVTFLALVAISLTSEEGGDIGDDNVVVVVVVKVQIFLGVGTRIYHRI